MSGARQWTAWTAALLLTLLVSAQAIALCCLDESDDRGSPVAAHGHASHPRSDRAPETSSALAAAASASVCDAPATPVPQLRERNRSDHQPVAGEAIQSHTIVVLWAPSWEPEIHPRAPVWSPDRGAFHPLRL